MKLRGFIVCLFVIFIVGDAVAGCSKTAQDLYSTAISITGNSPVDVERKIQLLKQVKKTCQNFNVYYELARAYNDLNEMRKVEQSLLDAHSFAGNDREKSKVHTFLGLVYEDMGREDDALFHYQFAWDRGGSPTVHEKIKSIEIKRMEQGMEVREIKAALLSAKRTYKAFGDKKGWGVRPAIQLYVNFDDNAWSLSDKGRIQAEKMGQALTSSEFVGGRFLIIGHTDSRGTDVSNMDLSQKRANTIVSFLEKQFFLYNLDFEGHGERELKYPQEKTKVEEALNRRVEVCIKGAGDE